MILEFSSGTTVPEPLSTEAGTLSAEQREQAERAEINPFLAVGLGLGGVVVLAAVGHRIVDAIKTSQTLNDRKHR